MVKRQIKVEAGCRARTNDLYARLISRTPREMTVLRPHSPIEGAWVVRWDGIEPIQIVNEKFLERIA